MVRDCAVYLLKKGKILDIPGLFVTSAFKYAGYRLGKKWDKLPGRLVRRLGMNKTYWDVRKNLTDTQTH